MFIKGIDAEKNSLLNIAEKMCIAARTAPKARGIDKIVTAILTADEKDTLAAMMQKFGEENNQDFFIRDSKNILSSHAVVLIGLKEGPRGTAVCGFCGFENCEEMSKNNGSCSIGDIDLGIALGSAASIAADNRVDTRIMFSAGRTAMEVNLLGDDVSKILALPLSASGKSIFFDRK